MSNGAKAGEAYVLLGIKNNLRRGLAQAESTLKSWGASVSMAGAAVTAAAGAGLGVFTGMAKGFADAGSEVYDLSKRTGVSAESLSAMKYAAEQNGSSLQTVAKSMGVVNKFTAQLAAGNKGAAKTMQQLGIDSKAFIAATPEQRFGMIADALNNIQDEGIRAGMAMKLLGKGGAELLPMLAGGSKGLEVLTNQARDLGIVISEEGAAKADALGDSWDTLGSVFKGVTLRIGDAVAGPLTQLIDIVIPIVAEVGKWISANQWLVTGILAGVVAVGAIGAAMVAFGATLTVAGVALGAIVSGFGMLAGLVTFLLSPMGIFIALMAGAVAYFLVATDAGNKLTTDLYNGFSDLLGIFKTTFGGIVDALSAGQLGLAGQIAMAGFNAAILKGYAIFQGIWGDFKVWFVNMFVDALNAVIGKTKDFLLSIAKMLNDAGAKSAAGTLATIAHFHNTVAEYAKDENKKQTNADVEQAQKDAEAAQKELARLSEQAAVAKEEARAQKEAAAAATVGLPQFGGLSFGGTGSSGGAFLASAAALLGNTPTTIAEQQLAAINAGNAKLDDIKDSLDNLGLEYGS